MEQFKLPDIELILQAGIENTKSDPNEVIQFLLEKVRSLQEIVDTRKAYVLLYNKGGNQSLGGVYLSEEMAERVAQAQMGINAYDDFEIVEQDIL